MSTTQNSVSNVKVFVILAAVLLTFAGAAAAQSTEGEVQGSKMFKLAPTGAGIDLEAEGVAELRSVGPIEELRLHFVAEVPEGTVLVVEVENAKGFFTVGSFKVEMGLGTFRLNSLGGPSAAFPIDQIKQISIVHARQRIAIGKVGS